MSQIETISWRDLPGNKYTKSLDAAMVSEQGYVIFGKVRHCHEPKAKMCNVIYDREYVIEFLNKRVLLALAVLKKEMIDELVDEAWMKLHGVTNDSQAVDDVAS